ncbi:CAP domain-containing protein [uncultured Marivita sp.]|uniref:CAP domain-containing protein n=1 Tax=uncultured Marivita sp. TaxID=888080 RepID=UPI00262A491A|nr:CAP domain-containing protein [uncultured Marivita sp.]
MKRSTFLLGAAALALTACAGAPPAPTLGPDGRPLPKLYRIRPGDTGRIQFRMLDAINALRQASGAPALELDSRLNAAAATHARDMSVQNRPWHFGSDGSSPITRIQRTGYNGRLVGEAISETYETELETLAAWMEAENTRTVILDPSAREMGFSWYQESNGKIWWNLILAAPDETGFVPVNAPS